MAKNNKRKGLKRKLTKRRPKPSLYRRRKYNRKKMWTRQRYRCGICKRRIPPGIIYSDLINVDHTIPRSHGGLTVPSNLKLVHMTCNQKKADSCVGCETCAP